MRDYFAAANEAFRSGTVDELKRLTATACPCRRLARDIERVYSKGGRYEDARYDVRQVKVHDVIADSAVAEVRADVPPFKVFDGSGDVSENSKGGSLHTDFSLIRKEGEWIIANSFDLG
jgi:hypothetical protein